MNTNFREMLGINTLTEACGVEKGKRNLHQKKAIHNFRYCANDQWQWVNSWYDEQDEDAREYMLSAHKLFDNIYYDAQQSVYDEGSCYFGSAAKEYLKDVRFCGSDFLRKICLYYTAQLLEESIYEVEGTEENAERILRELQEIKESIK